MWRGRKCTTETVGNTEAGMSYRILPILASLFVAISLHACASLSPPDHGTTDHAEESICPVDTVPLQPADALEPPLYQLAVGPIVASPGSRVSLAEHAAHGTGESADAAQEDSPVVSLEDTATLQADVAKAIDADVEYDAFLVSERPCDFFNPEIEQRYRQLRVRYFVNGRAMLEGKKIRLDLDLIDVTTKQLIGTVSRTGETPAEVCQAAGEAILEHVRSDVRLRLSEDEETPRLPLSPYTQLQCP